MAHIKDENVTPGDEPASGMPDGGGQEYAPSSGSYQVSSPQVGPVPLQVFDRVGRNQRETDLKNGCIRLEALMPFALARLGRPYGTWDESAKKIVVAHRSLPLRPHVIELSRRLACGTDLVFKWVNIMCDKGPENVVAGDLLKEATSGGKGRPRLVESEESALLAAVEQVCVQDGLKPATKKANRAIRQHLIQVSGLSRRISTATIKARSTSQHSSAQRRRLEAGLDREIRRLVRAKTLLGRIDPEVYRAGRVLFKNDAGLALWLSEPARSLLDRVPLAVMRTKAGREKVTNILRSLAHGNLV